MKLLHKDAYYCLVDALVRYKAYHDGEALTEAWTGLGTMTAYRQAYDEGYMRPLGTAPIPRTHNWWKLTEKGAAIVQAWLDQGYGSDAQPFYELSPVQIALNKYPPRRTSE